eukprot:SM000234S07890  [mRNA]  locus=s234:44549:48375:- [translate_table: standard]
MHKFHGGHAATSCLVDISCGLQHTAAVTTDGALFTWGSNEYGQLGDGSEDDSRDPKRVLGLDNEFVLMVACGAHCTAAVSKPRRAASACSSSGPSIGPASNKEGSHSPNDESSRLWVWGQNQGSNHPRLLVNAFHPDAVVIQVACGASHAAAVTGDGLLQTWGYNEVGQLGRGFSCDGRQKPGVVTKFQKSLDESPIAVVVKQVACGEYHTAAIADSGDLYTWGAGGQGQLGHRSLQLPGREVLPRRVVTLESASVCQVACGRSHTCAMTATGALYTWGGGCEGQLGVGAQSVWLPYSSAGDAKGCIQRLPFQLASSGVQKVACGQSHTLALHLDGRLLGFGYNSCGQAATGREPFAWDPAPINWCVGEVVKLAAGGGHSAVLTHARTLRELCELELADSISATNALTIAGQVPLAGSDALARYCLQFRERLERGFDDDIDDDDQRRR